MIESFRRRDLEVALNLLCLEFPMLHVAGAKSENFRNCRNQWPVTSVDSIPNHSISERTTKHFWVVEVTHKCTIHMLHLQVNQLTMQGHLPIVRRPIHS